MNKNITTISIEQDIITTEDRGVIRLTPNLKLKEKLGEGWREKFELVDISYNMIDNENEKVHYTVDLKEVENEC
jgi:hypothetical protein